MTLRDTLSDAIGWFTQGVLRPDTREDNYVDLRKRLTAVGASPWTYVMFMTYYDTMWKKEAAVSLKKTGYVLSPNTFERFLNWLDTAPRDTAEKVARQLKYLDEQRAIGMEADFLLKSKYIDVNVMVRLEKAVEWRDELEEKEYNWIVELFKERAIEMYMSLPWYKEYTPKACKLIEAMT